MAMSSPKFSSKWISAGGMAMAVASSPSVAMTNLSR